MRKVSSFILMVGILFLSHFSAKVIFQNVIVSKLLLSDAIPLIKIVLNETDSFTMLSYVDLIKNRFASEDVFIELPEDSVELIPDEVQKEDIVTEIEVEEDKRKSVTMDWARVLKNGTKFSVTPENLVNKKLGFELKKDKVNAIIYHTHTTESYTPSED